MITIETERLLLRNFTEDDFAAVHSYAGCAENVVYMVWGPNNEEQTRNFINMAIMKATEDPCMNYQFAAILKNTKKLIGACNLTRVRSDEAEIGWIVHHDYWKQGYGTEMGKAILGFGFDVLPLRRVFAFCDDENIGSYRVMEKIGMRREGLYIEGRQANKLSNKEYSDALSYAILKDEWEAGKEIAYYKTLPVIFNGFIDLPDLSDDVTHLVCTSKREAIPEKKYVPAYTSLYAKAAKKSVK